MKHSGKLFTCECQDCINKNGLLIGHSFGFNFNKLCVKKSKLKCSHSLFIQNIMANGKMSWASQNNDIPLGSKKAGSTLFCRIQLISKRSKICNCD